MRALRRFLTTPAALALILIAIAGCRRPKDGDSYYGNGSSSPPVVEPSDTELTDAEDLPGLNFNVLGVEGGSGDDGNFQAGDSISVNFTVTRNDGSALSITEVDRFEAHVSGPTFNYQRVIAKINVIPSIGEIPGEIQFNDDGSYTYEFPPLPDDYIDPPNYTGANPTDVLSGTPLLSGTYTVVLIAYKNYTWGTQLTKDVANTTYDFLFGDVSVLEPREVVTQANCASCHDDLQHHTRGLPGGGRRKDVKTCVTCHVAGAEDWNDPTIAGGTPGASVDFKVMIHKIHNSAHLPSVLGIGTDPTDGSRDYMVAPAVYELVSDELEVTEYEVGFPVWPNLNVAMPRDYGYTISEDAATTQLTTGVFPYVSPTALNGRTWRQNDDSTRTGVTACHKCHGDPDEAGPLPEPAQGDLHETQPSRRACGSCHDDVDFSGSYRSNMKTMPPQATDSDCITCHVGGADPLLDIETAHEHPLLDTDLMPAGRQGINVEIVDIDPDGVPGNLYLQPGMKMEITFTVKDDAGDDIGVTVPGTGYTPAPNPWPFPWGADQSGFWTTFSCVVTGPTENGQVLNYIQIPCNHPVFAGGVPPVGGEYTMYVPGLALYERIGVATAGLDAFTTALDNHLNLRYASPPAADNTGLAPTIISSRAAGTVATGTVVTATVLDQNWLDWSATVPAAGTTWVKGDYVCVGDGLGNEEYLRVQYVQADINGTLNDRLWFTSTYSLNTITAVGSYGPWLRFAHAAGEATNEVTVTNLASTTWTLGGALMSTITEAGAGWTAGATILASYTGDWECPSTYPSTYNSSPDLTETAGKWEGKRVAPGTYRIGVWTRYPWNYPTPDIASYTRPPGDTGYPFEQNSYPITSPPGNAYFWVNNPVLNAVPYGLSKPSEIEPYEIIAESGETCYACHNDIWFHGGSRRGFDTCILCHGNAGTEDSAQYRFGAPIMPSTGATINFRTMLHKIHHGKDLENGDTYYITGYSGGAGYFDEIAFPTMPDRTKHCAKCHGKPELEEDLGTWEVPKNRNHPTDQVLPVREYKMACNTCHDSGDATAHIDLMTSPAGEESCGTCHGPDATYSIGIMHRPK
ncbi:MAG: hypothetical protein HYY18_17670 [Planctomycetes bacterium]|nr:hypothetical protein [Planctomycetota bacterium]